MNISQDQFIGCMLGLALGDALGAPYEGGLIERSLWRLIGTTRSGKMRWTDDTQMSLDLAESLIAKKVLDPDDIANRFARSYRWSRGYGPGTAKLLKRIQRGRSWQEATHSVYPDGSFGNGGAMRAPVLGLFYTSEPNQLIEAAQVSAQITHAHPLGIEGTVLVASAVVKALLSANGKAVIDYVAQHCQATPFKNQLQIAQQWIGTEQEPEPKQVVKQLGHTMLATESCVTSIYLGARFISKSFSELYRFVIACGGDADTIGAMSAAIWGAANGAAALPEDLLQKLEQRDRIISIADALYHTASS